MSQPEPCSMTAREAAADALAMNVIKPLQKLGAETMINETEIAQQIARSIAWETFSQTPDTRRRIAALVEDTLKHLYLDDETRKRIVYRHLPAELTKMSRDLAAASQHTNHAIYTLASEGPLRKT
jgi:hypothetical protein